MKPVWYTHIDHEDYKSLEKQMKDFEETVHKTTTGFYHKSIRIRLSGVVFEFHGPNVGGYGHEEDTESVPVPVIDSVYNFDDEIPF